MGDPVRASLVATRTLFGQELPDGVRLSAAALAAEGRFWWRLQHPQMDRWLDRARRLKVFARRRPNLPKRLLTPGWIPKKLHELRYAWFPPRERDQRS